jgi:adenosine deaminase
VQRILKKTESLNLDLNLKFLCYITLDGIKLCYYTRFYTLLNQFLKLVLSLASIICVSYHSYKTIEIRIKLTTIDPKLPFIDLHRHLDGSIRLDTIIDLSRHYFLDLPAWEKESLRPYVQITQPQSSVMAFIEKFHWMTHILVDYDACRRIAYENLEDAKKEGLDYVELRFSPWFMAEAHHLDPSGIVEAVCDGVEAGSQDFKMRANLIGILSRTYGPEIGWKELNALSTQQKRMVALDLAGDEANFPAHLFKEHFKKARDLGWKVTIHAGESAGPESIWQAINDLGASRIGHAVTALADSSLIDFMRDHKIGIECNLTSNVQTSTVPDYARHPLRHFLEEGLIATINTDDLGISNIDLAYEYEVAAPAAGLSIEQIHQAQRNALEISFLDSQEKEELLKLKSKD